MTIDVLPDDVLVEIFFYVNITGDWDIRNPWHALVDVCRRWRYVVYSSPRRLDLRFEYRGYGPMSEVPDAWQALPVILTSSSDGHPNSRQRWDNRVAALESEHYNRICEIEIFGMTKLRWKRFVAAMQKPFLELTELKITVYGVVPVLPDSFLGGSAPRLQALFLGSIPFPSIPKLLLSAHDLVRLTLWDIPDSGYFSPDAMATALSVMTRLESLDLRFRSLLSRPDPASRPPPPPTRPVLPVLTKLVFQGVCEYSEDLLARIGAPLLYDLHIVFFMDFIMDFNFDARQLHRLICHAEEFKACDYATVVISNVSIRLSLYPKTSVVDDYILFELEIECNQLGPQLSSLSQTCNSSFPFTPTLEELEIREDDDLPPSDWKENAENAQWVELLTPFTALKNLYLTDQIARQVCGALQELPEEMATEVLPALRNLFVDRLGSLEQIQEAIRPFVATRQLSGHPVAIEHWRKE